MGSHFSMEYCIISRPPSSSGGFHSNINESFLMSFNIIGPSGLLGLSISNIFIKFIIY